MFCDPLQDEARRLAEQVHALEDTRNRWNAEIAAREAVLAQKENDMVATVRQKEAEQRRRLAQDERVRIHLACVYYKSAACLIITLLNNQQIWHLLLSETTVVCGAVLLFGQLHIGPCANTPSACTVCVLHGMLHAVCCELRNVTSIK